MVCLRTRPGKYSKDSLIPDDKLIDLFNMGQTCFKCVKRKLYLNKI